MSLDILQNVNVLAELDRLGIRYIAEGGEEVRVKCPFHQPDHDPSCHIHLGKRVYKCWAANCNQHGDFVSFLAGQLRVPRSEIFIDLATRYRLDKKPTKIVEVALIEEYHAAIWAAKPLLSELYKRGVTDDMVRQYRLGENNGRIIIPIKDELGFYVNLRSYLPGAPANQKMKAVRGYGKQVRLYPIEQMKYSKVVLCGGEMKAIVAAAQLNQHNIGAVSTTGGEGKGGWTPEIAQQFKDKHMWVCFDVDAGGKTGTQFRCLSLHSVVSWLGAADLPLDLAKYPKGDINDFVATEGGDLLGVLNDTPRWEPPVRVIPFAELSAPEDTDLTRAMHAEEAGKRVKLKAMVSAMGETPYSIPHTIKVTCDRAQPECGLCQVSASNATVHEIPPESPALLEMVAQKRTVQREACMRGIGVPVSCKSYQHEIIDHYNIEDARIDPQLEITSNTTERKMQPALCVGRGLLLNENYSLVGRMHPNPNTQESTLLISEYEQTQDSLSTYQPTADSLESLLLFRPVEWSVAAIQAKLDDIYHNLEQHITRIFERRDAHLMVDLCYHSVLLLPSFVPGGRPTKGWVEVLLIGDSAQGKSDITCGREGNEGLAGFYGLGEKCVCKGATVPGLLGGMQTIGKRWYVTWGKIPSNDRRLCIMDEVKGMTIEVVGQLTDMRSSGVAQLIKIEQRKTHARTRLVWSSNPRKEKSMAQHSFGIEAVRDLFGANEDVRRLDAAMVLQAGQVTAARLKELQSVLPTEPNRYPAQICRDLILWSWTRQTEQVMIEADAMEHVANEAVRLCGRYTETIPLVDSGSMRQKLLRLSVALACRTFSANDDMTRAVLRKCHVEFLVQYLTRLYDSPAMGYGDITEAIRINETLVDADKVVAKINLLPYPGDFCKAILHAQYFDVASVQDWCNWDRSDAMDFCSFLVRKHCVLPVRRGYEKSSPFIALVKELLNGSGKLVDKPDFMRKDEY